MILGDDKRKAVLSRGLETPFKTPKRSLCNAFELETCFCRDDKRKVVLKGVISMDLLHTDIHPRVNEFMHLSLSKVSQKHFKHAFPL